MIKTIKKGKEVSIRKIRTVVILREVGDGDWGGSTEESKRLRKFSLDDLGDGYRVFTL